jgi:hypothetical protein
MIVRAGPVKGAEPAVPALDSMAVRQAASEAEAELAVVTKQLEPESGVPAVVAEPEVSEIQILTWETRRGIGLRLRSEYCQIVRLCRTVHYSTTT